MVPEFVKDVWFLGPVLLIALIGFGFSATNETVGIDDLERSRYIGEGNVMVRAGRWGHLVWPAILGTTRFQPYAEQVIGVCLLIAAAVCLAILFHKASGGQLGRLSLTSFACLFVSYPLIAEIWAYSGANVLVAGGYLLASGAVLLLLGWRFGGQWWRPLGAIALLAIVAASYESLMAVFVLAGFAVLTLGHVFGSAEDRRMGGMVRWIGLLAVVAAAGIAVRLVVHQILLLALDLRAQPNGATGIRWGSASAAATLFNLIARTFKDYILMALWYPPIALFVAMSLVAVAMAVWVAVRRKTWAALVPFGGMLASTVVLSLIQGSVTPYRAAQPLAVFVAFILMLALDFAMRVRRRWLGVVAVVAVSVLAVQQAVYLNGLLSLNHLRSEEEAAAVRAIGYRLAADSGDKPVIFTGKYALSAAVLEPTMIPVGDWRWWLANRIVPGGMKPQVRFVQSIDNSVINWSVRAFGDQSSMLKLFNHYGFNYRPADFSLYPEAAHYASTNMAEWPKRDSIMDVGDYVIVNFGND